MNQYLKAALIILALGGILLIGLPMVVFGVMWHEMWGSAERIVHEQR